MLTKFRRHIAIIVLLLACGIFFFSIHKDNAVERLYTQQDFNKDIGKVYAELGDIACLRNDYEAATGFYKHALDYRLHDIEILDKLGICYERRNNLDAALQCYTLAMSINPYVLDIRSNGDYSLPERVVSRDVLPECAMQWKGESLKHKSIYLYAEKGLSETIMFWRFLPLLVQEGAAVFVQPQKELQAFLHHTESPITIIRDDKEAARLHVDYYASLCEVLHFLGVRSSDISSEPYLLLPERPEGYPLLPEASDQALRVGIVWNGNPEGINDKKRSVSLAFFYDIARMKGIQLYAFQLGVGREQLGNIPEDVTIIDCAQDIHDMSDTASLLRQVDLLISVDTSIAHLAGALGVPTLLLLPYHTDWRWFSNTEKGGIVWYRTVTLLRQDEQSSWAPVFERVKALVGEKQF